MIFFCVFHKNNKTSSIYVCNSVLILTQIRVDPYFHVGGNAYKKS